MYYFRVINDTSSVNQSSTTTKSNSPRTKRNSIQMEPARAQKTQNNHEKQMAPFADDDTFAIEQLFEVNELNSG